MGNFLHRTTLSYLYSVSPNELTEPLVNYVVEPDMSPVAGEPVKYWKLTGDILSVMNQTEKDAVDAQLLSDSRDATVDPLDDVEDLLRHIVDKTIREVNLLRQWIMDYKAEVAAATSHGNLKTRVAAMNDLDDRTFSQFKTQVRNDLGT